MSALARFAVPCAAAALLVLTAAPGQAAGTTDPKAVATPGAGESRLSAQPVVGEVVEPDGGTSSSTSTSLPAGGLAAALLVAGAGTVLATRAICSGRGR